MRAKKVHVAVMISFLLPFLLAYSATTYRVENVASISAVVKTGSNALLPALISSDVKTGSNVIPSASMTSAVRTSVKWLAKDVWFLSVSPNTVGIGEKVRIQLTPDKRYITNISQYRPRISIFLQEEGRWVLQGAPMILEKDSFIYEYSPPYNGTYAVYVEIDGGSRYLANAFFVGPAQQTSIPVAWIAIILLVVVIFLILRRSQKPASYRYRFLFLFYIFLFFHILFLFSHEMEMEVIP